MQKISKELAKHRLEQAKEDLEAGKLLYDKNFYKSANNRAYYSCFHAIDAVLAKEPVAFKKHKDTLSYFNKNYVHTEIFPRDIGRKISRLEIIRHKSDYDTFYIASKEDASEQVSVAEEVIDLVRKYLLENSKNFKSEKF